MEQINSINLLQTPCFILDPTELSRSVKGFKTALDEYFDRSIVGYSVKTNSVPKCLKMACDMGCYAEVVSHDEYELALICGYTKNHIIYNGPMKSKKTFMETVMNGAIVNIETKRELHWLSELPSDKIYKIGLRLNVNISHVSPEDADGEDDNSRFGFSDETKEFNDAVLLIHSLPWVKLCGLHIHRTSHSRSIRFYKASIAFACEIIKKYGLSLEYIDVGGGYYGIFPNKPTYKDYCNAFYEVLQSYGLHKLQVIVEPGNALVASCFTFLTEVIDTKHVEEKLWFATTNGSRNDIDPFFKKSTYLCDIHYCKNTPNVEKQIVCGCTCLEYDRLFSLENKPLLSIGDRISYKNVGAYTMCLSPMFIRYIPNIYQKTDGVYELIREKWSAKDFVKKNIF